LNAPSAEGIPGTRTFAAKIHRLVAASAIGLAVIELSAAGCSQNDAAQEAAKSKVAPGVPVVTASVVRKTMPVKLQAIGNVEPYTTVAVKSRIDGQITAVRFQDGQDVKEGQLLFELDPRALQAQVKQLQANLQRDTVIVANNQAKEKRYADLLEKGFISADASHPIKTDLDAAQANVQADQAGLESARVQLSYTRIVSPIAGRAGKIMIQIGNVVKANDTQSLVIINAVVPIYVSFAVPEQYLSDIRAFMAKGALGVQAAPTGATTAETDGQLSFIDNLVDAQTGTIRLRATFPNKDHVLWPGQFANVTLLLRQQSDAIVIPSQALQNGPNGQYVYVVRPQDQSAEMRSVTLERMDGLEAVIASGLKEGETVVTSGQIRLTPGAKVAPKAG
jgi:membrane fusion protein, multidrug efflux system